MMNNWKDLLIVSTLWSGLSLYALQDPAVQVQAPVSPAKGTAPNPVVPVLSPAKGASDLLATPTVSVVDQKARENHYLQVLGHMIIDNTGALEFGLDLQQKEQLMFGLKAALNGEELPELNQKEIEEFQRFLEKQKEIYITEIKKRDEAFLAAKQKEPDVQKTVSGSLYKITKQGNSKRAGPDDSVKVGFTVRSIDGKIIENTNGLGELIYLFMLPLGVAEVIQLIGEGGTIQAWIPPELAYGDGHTLEFFIEVHEINQPTPEKEELKKEEPKVDTKTPSK
ncbi:MAG: hypothetical protein LBD60_01285 [Puniceicoccales bacterium]|jgi:FKBP-type peptidyl-prolyl cis-trans isomerase|nr:hypothetical protein [Puniceicoccales bacterium]